MERKRGPYPPLLPRATGHGTSSTPVPRRSNAQPASANNNDISDEGFEMNTKEVNFSSTPVVTRKAMDSRRKKMGGSFPFLDEDGCLWFRRLNSEIVPAVYHRDIVPYLLQQADKRGSYDCRHAHGSDEHDRTAFVPSQKSWGLALHQRPEVLFVIWPDHNVYPVKVATKYMKFQDCLVLDSRDEPIKQYAELPSVISSYVEGYLMEAWMRTNRAILDRDLLARQVDVTSCNKPRKQPARNTLNMRRVHYRFRTSSLAWTQATVADQNKEVVLAAMDYKYILANSVKGRGDVHMNESKKIAASIKNVDRVVEDKINALEQLCQKIDKTMVLNDRHDRDPKSEEDTKARSVVQLERDHGNRQDILDRPVASEDADGGPQIIHDTAMFWDQDDLQIRSSPGAESVVMKAPYPHPLRWLFSAPPFTDEDEKALVASLESCYTEATQAGNTDECQGTDGSTTDQETYDQSEELVLAGPDQIEEDKSGAPQQMPKRHKPNESMYQRKAIQSASHYTGFEPQASMIERLQVRGKNSNVSGSITSNQPIIRRPYGGRNPETGPASSASRAFTIEPQNSFLLDNDWLTPSSPNIAQASGSGMNAAYQGGLVVKHDEEALAKRLESEAEAEFELGANY